MDRDARILNVVMNAGWIIPVLLWIIFVPIIADARVPTQDELLRKYGHRTVASATCRDVREAVALYGRATAEATALQYGMTESQRQRALACLTIRNRR